MPRSSDTPRGPFGIAFFLCLWTVIGLFPLGFLLGEVVGLTGVGAVAFVFAAAVMSSGGDRRSAAAVVAVPLLGIVVAIASDRVIAPGHWEAGSESGVWLFIGALLGAWASNMGPLKVPGALVATTVALGCVAVAASLALIAARPPMVEVLTESPPIATVVPRELPSVEEELELHHEGVTLRVSRHGQDGLSWETDTEGLRNGYGGGLGHEARFHVAHHRLIVLAGQNDDWDVVAIRHWPTNDEAMPLRRSELGLWAPSGPATGVMAIICLTAIVALARSRRSRAREDVLADAVEGTLGPDDVVELEDGTSYRVEHTDVPPGRVGVVVVGDGNDATYRDAGEAPARVVCGELEAARKECLKKKHASMALAMSAALTAVWLAVASTIF